MNKFILACIMLACCSTSEAAETIKIKWDGNHPHNKSLRFDDKKPVNAWPNVQAGWSTNFNNGSPQEFGAIKKDGELNITLYKAGNTPTPFVVFLHGCSGLPTVVKEFTQELAWMLNAQGVGLAVVDSFTTRFVDDVCGIPGPHWARRRADDAASTLDYLIDNRYARKDQVYVMGQSNGGTTAIAAVSSRMLDRKNRFAAVISLEGGCNAGFPYEKSFSFYAPIYMLLAELDEINPLSDCLTLAKKFPGKIQMEVLKGSHHGYLFKQPPGKSKWGWATGYDDRSTKMAMGLISQFIKNPKISAGQVTYR